MSSVPSTLHIELRQQSSRILSLISWQFCHAIYGDSRLIRCVHIKSKRAVSAASWRGGSVPKAPLDCSSKPPPNGATTRVSKHDGNKLVCVQACVVGMSLYKVEDQWPGSWFTLETHEDARMAELSKQYALFSSYINISLPSTPQTSAWLYYIHHRLKRSLTVYCPWLSGWLAQFKMTDFASLCISTFK